MTADAIAQPLCASAEGHSWLRPRLEKARDLLLRELTGSAIEGLVLVGSLARGEASVLEEDGNYRLLGDVEFLVIVRDQPRWREFRRALEALGRGATEHLSEQTSPFTVEFTPADLSYLRKRALPSAFTWDVRRHGRVLHGRPDLLEEMPGFEVSAIPPEDSIETLMNRGLELLAARNDNRDGEDRAYALVKGALDAAGSALAFDGHFESLVARRPKAFRQLVGRRAELGKVLADPEGFSAVIDRAAAVKLRPTAQALEEFADAAETGRMLQWILDLWQWEVRQIVNQPDGRASDLLRAYLARESVADRLRGWLKYAWHPLRPESAPLGPRLLTRARNGSPRRLVYAAAVEAIEGRENWPERVAGLLPVARADRGRALPQILETWTWLVRNN